MKSLYKSRTNKMVSGVCGGIGEYFGVDPTIIRLRWVLGCAVGGSGFLAYVIAAILIPDAPAGRGKHEKGTAVSDPCPGPAGGPRLPPPEALRRRRVRSWEGMAKAMPSLSVSGAFPAGRMENRPFPLTSRPGDDKMKC